MEDNQLAINYCSNNSLSSYYYNKNKDSNLLTSDIYSEKSQKVLTCSK